MKQVQHKQIVLNPVVIAAINSIFIERFVGKKCAVKTKNLLTALAFKGVFVNDRALRMYIGHIRNNDMLKPGYILSNVSCGYWFSADRNEQDDYIEQEMTRLSHQFANLEPLHKRVRYNNHKPTAEQIPLFQT